jgi:hypothetical protein
MRWALILLSTAWAFAEPPPDVLDLFREAAEALATDDASAFLAKFDPNMAGYAAFRD